MHESMMLGVGNIRDSVFFPANYSALKEKQQPILINRSKHVNPIKRMEEDFEDTDQMLYGKAICEDDFMDYKHVEFSPEEFLVPRESIKSGYLTLVTRRYKTKCFAVVEDLQLVMYYKENSDYVPIMVVDISALQWADVLNTTINISKSAEKKYGSSSGDYMSSPDIKIEVTCGKDFQQRLVVIKKNILAVYETSKVVKLIWQIISLSLIQ